ncbi:hypothetical protein CBR_g4360 [Chara braunii]|uniref:EF-hand domain-containing protein n=1 Tax=Chara braunii TaxID=69332 RepID=A0A388KHH6_CHABU|nr:hypothetical protein CBR_g4360 [Chara braunii]|eukprot:GBG69524.1 hypothetical protein CBR_g4360 [Chara braunii]
MGVSCSCMNEVLRRKNGGWNKHTPVDLDRFVGMARIEIEEAHMKRSDKWFAVISLGRQAFKTDTSTTTSKPVWKSGVKVVLDKDGPSIARICVYDFNRTRNNVLVGICDLDLKFIPSKEGQEPERQELVLFDPSTKKTTVGTITVSYISESRDVVLRDFAKRLLAIVDLDGNGTLSINEFKELVKAFGNPVSSKKLEELFNNCDLNKDGTVCVDELANLIVSADSEDFSAFTVKQCPVCGESLKDYDDLNDIIHMSLCFNEDPFDQTMTGGFLTDKQAANG